MQISTHTHTQLIFTPDGRWLLAIEDFPGEPDYISVIRTADWELVARQPIRDLLRAGVFLDGGTRFLGAGRNGHVATWDFHPETGMIGMEREWMRYGAGITGMLPGRDGRSLIISTGRTGLALAELDVERRKVIWSPPTTPGIVALAHLGEDRFISSGWDHRMRVWKRTPPTSRHRRW